MGRSGETRRSSRQEFQATHARHLDIRQHQIPRLRPDARQRDDRIGGVRDLEPAPPTQQKSEEPTDHRIVLNYENPSLRVLALSVSHSCAPRPGQNPDRHIK